MAITFEVSNVERAREPFRVEPRTVQTLNAWRVEAGGAAEPFASAGSHALLDAAHVAYARHYPLVLSPDAVWLAIAQGFARHVDKNAERLRGKFVRDQGRAKIEVRRDDFVKGSPHNPWPEVFTTFSDRIGEHIGRQRDLLVCDFSTTTPFSRAASEVVLMDAMQRYFEYSFNTLCGIPEITLEGTVADWRSIVARVRVLEEYDLRFWTEALEPVLEQFVAASQGSVDVRFWESLFKPANGSGGPRVHGWINVFFPYLAHTKDGDTAHYRNDALHAWCATNPLEMRAFASSIPSGLSAVPFTWRVMVRTFEMYFLAGFVGLGRDEATGGIRPVIGWAVADDAAARAPTRKIECEFGRRPPQPPRPPGDEALAWVSDATNAQLVSGYRVRLTGTALRLKDVLERMFWRTELGAIRFTPIPPEGSEPGRELSLEMVIGRSHLGPGAGGPRRYHYGIFWREMDDVRRKLAAHGLAVLDEIPALYLGSRERRTLRYGYNAEQSYLIAEATEKPVPIDLSEGAEQARVALAKERGYFPTALPFILTAP